MEDSTAKGLKEARKRRERIAKVKAVIIGAVGIWLLLSVAICWFLAWKMYRLEEKVDYLLDNFTVSGRMEAESKQTVPDTDESTYFNLENSIDESLMDEMDYGVVPAMNQQENMADEDDAHRVYLTFDDGPSGNTSQILDILQKYNLKATFFVIGREGEENEALYKRIVEEGHTLAMH